MILVLELILLWLSVYAIFTGLGLCIVNLFGLHVKSELDLLLAFWLGFAGVIGSLQIWNLFFPVNHIIRIILASVAIFFLIRQYKTLWQIYRKIPWYLYLILVIVLISVAKRAFGAPIGFDTGLYHLQILRWIEFAPVVPGLANLLGRLGFSNMFALYASFIAIGKWSASINIATYGSLHIITLLTLTSIIWHDHKSFARFMAILLFPAVVGKIFRDTHGLVTDPIVFILQSIILCLTIFFLSDTTTSDKQKNLYLLSLSTLLALAALIKLSSAIFSLILFIVIWGIMLKRNPDGVRQLLVKTIIFLVLLTLPFLIRNVIVSGYIMYPVVQTQIPLDWTVRQDDVIIEANWVRVWARQKDGQYHGVLDNWDWFNDWYSFHIRYGFLGRTLPIIAASLLVMAIRFKQIRLAVRNNTFDKTYFFIFFALLMSVIYWFFTAPDPRFAGVTILGLSYFILYMALMTLPIPVRSLVVLLFAGILLFNARPALSLFYQGFPQQMPVPPSVVIGTYTTPNGGVINYPMTDTLQCWDAPLPCSLNVMSRLEVRDVDDIRQGFKSIIRSE